MLPSPVPAGEGRTAAATTTFHHHRNSPSSSTTSLSSPSPPPGGRTTEEVWKDINLSSLHDMVPGTPSIHHRPDPAIANSVTSPSFRSIIFQDFLNRPASATHPPPPPSPPVAVLSLNPDFHPFNHHEHIPCHLIPNATGDGAFGKKRFPERENGAPVDRRHKRMIKNRESAARSRARKQAYINELELEVAHLEEENARLKEQQQKQILQAPPAVQVPNKRALHRTSTAPF